VNDEGGPDAWTDGRNGVSSDTSFSRAYETGILSRRDASGMKKSKFTNGTTHAQGIVEGGFQIQIVLMICPDVFCLMYSLYQRFLSLGCTSYSPADLPLF
jgi:hypothetical protein